MATHYSSYASKESVSHVRDSARGMRKNYNLHVDSGYKSQHGKQSTKVAYGTGWVLIDSNSPHKFDGIGARAYWDSYINHSMEVELEGIYHALKVLNDEHYGIIHPTNHLSIYCDSSMVEYIMNRRMKGHKAPLYVFDVVERIMSFRHLVHMKFHWEKGHVDNIANNIADKIALYTRKDLERNDALGVIQMDLLILDILQKFDYRDDHLVKHILSENRRHEICTQYGSVELSYAVFKDSDGRRFADWYAISSHGLDVGTIEIEHHGGGLDMVQLAHAVLTDYRNSEFFDKDKTVYFAVPMNRALIDGILSIRNGVGRPKDNRSANAVVMLDEHLNEINVRLVHTRIR